MEVTGLQEVKFNRLHNVFPYAKKPAFAFTDFFGDFGLAQQIATDFANGNVRTGQENLEIDAVIRGVYPRRLFVPHDNVLTYEYGGQPSDGNPPLYWLVSPDAYLPGGFVLQNYEESPLYYFALESCNPGSQVYPFTPAQAYMELTTSGHTMQGFTMLLKQLAYGIPLNSSPSFAVRWTIGDANGNNRRQYSISFQQGKAVKFALRDDLNAEFTVICDIKAGIPRNSLIGNISADSQFRITQVGTGGGSDFFAADIQAARLAAPTALEVRFLGGQLQIWIGNSDVPFIWPDARFDPDTNVPYWFIDSITVSSFNYDYMSFSAHPSKWANQASLISNEQQLGFIPDPTSPAQYSVHLTPHTDTAASATDTGFAPPGTSATASDYSQNGTLLRYGMVIDNGPPEGDYKGDYYCEHTAVVRAVTGRFAPVIKQKPASPQYVQPMLVSVTHNFNYEQLCINSSANLTFDNFNGAWSNAIDGGFIENGITDDSGVRLYRGHMALNIKMGVSTNLGDFPLIQRFAGIGNIGFSEQMGAGGRSEVSIFATDSWLPLNQPKFAWPWMDGYNIYYAMYEIAQRGGVTPERMQFYNDGFVPDTPYGPCPNGSPTIYLPIGPAGSPLTRFGGGQTPASIMKKIAYTHGFILFFDVFATLQFFKFVLSDVPAPVQIFTYVPGDQGELTEIWNARYSGDTNDVRNQVSVIGVNAFGPIWNPIVAHESDDDSIENDDAFNFIGFPAELVWVDNQFVNQEYATAAAKTMLQFLRVPPRFIELDSWMQPDRPVYPLDVIRIDNPKSAAAFGPKDFLVLGTTDSQAWGESPRTTLRGRWLPPLDPTFDPASPNYGGGSGA